MGMAHSVYKGHCINSNNNLINVFYTLNYTFFRSQLVDECLVTCEEKNSGPSCSKLTMSLVNVSLKV